MKSNSPPFGLSHEIFDSLVDLLFQRKEMEFRDLALAHGVPIDQLDELRIHVLGKIMQTIGNEIEFRKKHGLGGLAARAILQVIPHILAIERYLKVINYLVVEKGYITLDEYSSAEKHIDAAREVERAVGSSEIAAYLEDSSELKGLLKRLSEALIKEFQGEEHP